MIIVSKSERDAIASRFPNVTIIRTKHHYYCEENRGVMRMLGRGNDSIGGNKKYSRHNDNRRWRNNDR